jgi:ATP-binding cassette subfamily C (CFTR/MRP) protein 2
MVRASALMHKSMLTNILRAPMSFFDTTPIGRIVNRFSRDIETVDNNLPQIVWQWLTQFFTSLSVLVVITYSTPVFLVVILPLGILYYIMMVSLLRHGCEFITSWW